MTIVNTPSAFTAGERAQRPFAGERFRFSKKFRERLASGKPPFGYEGFGEILFYRTYSREKEDGRLETWADCVLRVIEGVMSIRKSHYRHNQIPWNEPYWERFAADMAISMYRMHWLPPGRGLWAMGTQFMYERGAMALYNCAYTDLKSESLDEDLHWLMDCLMNGVGVGFGATRDYQLSMAVPYEEPLEVFITDTREGWCDSVRMLLNSYMNGGRQLRFNYSQIRPKGRPIRGFGGTSSGPEPLQSLHENIHHFCHRFIKEEGYDEVMLKTDLANLIGCCVVAGNVRRSAEIGLARVSDPVFKDLKNYEGRFAYRQNHGWMSNNSVKLYEHSDFEQMGELAERIRNNGEPGYVNMINLKYGRLRTAKRDNVADDMATGINPCGEVPLESREVCNLAETFPTVCPDVDNWFSACRYATFYCSTVALLPTHSETTNRVVMRNRRIGVGIVDFTGWKHRHGLNKVIRWMRDGYKYIKMTNKKLALECGVMPSIRVTTVKPGGTIPKLPGRSSGLMHPNFRYMIRRFSVAEDKPLVERLIEAGIPHEPSAYSKNTLVFEVPLMCGPARPAGEISVWEQAANLTCLQENWADNAVSNTVMFRKEESDQLESLLSHLATRTKSVSMLQVDTNAYDQMPEQEISRREYKRRLRQIRPVNFEGLKGDSQGDMYCDGEVCSI